MMKLSRLLSDIINNDISEETNLESPAELEVPVG